MGLNAKESAERMGSVRTSYLLSVIGEKGRNVPDLGVLHIYIYTHTHTHARTHMNAAKRTLEAGAD